MTRPSVLISILNWNNAEETIHCVASLAAEVHSDSFDVEVRVIDNGSTLADYLALQEGAQRICFNITRLEHNLGFTGGHNTSIAWAHAHNFDYVWLLNNDATVLPGCLSRLVRAMETESRIGAVSPVIEPRGGGDAIAAWGGMHNWATRETVWFKSEAQSRAAHVEHPDELFVAGTASMLRISALAQVGDLDDRLFAYYDDSDIGVRLARKGWRSKVIFDAAIDHGWRTIDQLPDYFFYLFYRNELIFLHTHMPAGRRRFLWAKLVNQALYNAIRLPLRGMHTQAKAALLGIWDFIIQRHGRPDLARKVPFLMHAACRLSILMHKERLKAYKKTLMAQQLSQE
ncbi:glycosyltransferase family 2 protein [Massilia sp. S19_KUP03_FR1]|uniref:glycosyltransferase family 2 protein n=1 Tax=Massilia sp. S19_KUP03_FR1 TaxID=3025503 RepID=UPI002FCDD5F1